MCAHAMEYYPAIKKNEKPSYVATWMDLETVLLTELSDTEKDKYCMILLITWNLKKNGINKLTHETEIELQI